MKTPTAFNTLIEVQQYFQDEAFCRQYLAEQRWGKGPAVCHHCGTIGAYPVGKRYQCCAKECKKFFSVTTGTIYENTKLKLSVWFTAIYLCSNRRRGTNSVQLAKDLGITQKAAWHLLHRIREMLRDAEPAMLTGMVEADETGVGGSIKNKPLRVREQLERNDNKTTVFGIVERGGQVVAQSVADRTRATLRPIMRKHVAIGSVVITDEHTGYAGLSKEYGHATVSHSAGEYVRGGVHTQTIEGFWSELKRTIHGTYVQVSPKHLNAYVNEAAYRYNTRHFSGQDRHVDTVKRAEGKRLKYADLIAAKTK